MCIQKQDRKNQPRTRDEVYNNLTASKTPLEYTVTKWEHWSFKDGALKISRWCQIAKSVKRDDTKHHPSKWCRCSITLKYNKVLNKKIIIYQIYTNNMNKLFFQ